MHIDIIDEPLLDRVHRLASPSFPVTHPEIRNAKLMPKVIAGSMDARWSARFFPVRPVDFYRLRDVYVCGEGLVFDTKGRLYRSTIAQHTEAAIDEAADALAGARATGEIPAHAGPAVLCKKIGSYNYGHWLMELWPRAVLARAAFIQPGLRYVVHAHEGALARVMRDGLALAGIRSAAILPTPWAPQFFEELIVIDGLTEHGSYMSPLAVTCLDPIIAGIPAGDAERLYVTRRDVGFRHFAREAAMMRIAEREGYTVIEPAQMSFKQQIGMFKGARRVVGITGAGITNTVFMPPGGAVRLFVPATMPDTFFWFISQIRRHAYAEYRCPEAGGKSTAHGHSWNANLTVSADEFRRFING